jgi:hypothetical protein
VTTLPGTVRVKKEAVSKAWTSGFHLDFTDGEEWSILHLKGKKIVRVRGVKILKFTTLNNALYRVIRIKN